MVVETRPTIYYIALDGKDSNSGTSSAPWATFAKARNCLKPGDGLFIKEGIYYQK